MEMLTGELIPCQKVNPSLFLIIVLLICNSHAIKLIDLKSINMVKQESTF